MTMTHPQQSVMKMILVSCSKPFPSICASRYSQGNIDQWDTQNEKWNRYRSEEEVDLPAELIYDSSSHRHRR